MKEIIKKYLEGCCQADPYFKAKYVESQLDKCLEFITDMARERANGSNCIAIEDATVFKWARDFFNDGTAALEEERKQKEFEERQKRLEEEANRKAEEEKKRIEKERYDREHALGQTTIFDLLGG